jgi:hypothetical protein
MASFAIGEQIKTGGEDLLEKFQAEPAAVKDNVSHRRPTKLRI